MFHEGISFNMSLDVCFFGVNNHSLFATSISDFLSLSETQVSTGRSRRNGPSTIFIPFVEVEISQAISTKFQSYPIKFEKVLTIVFI